MSRITFKKLATRLVQVVYNPPKQQTLTLNFSGKSSGGYFKPVATGNHANDFIISILKKQEPALISRLGATELKAVNNYLVQHLSDYGRWNPDVIEELFTHSGVFPQSSESADQFSIAYIDAIRSGDLMGVWDNLGESQVIELLAPCADLCELKDLEPFFHDEPWTKYLQGKRVLVIHPFEQTIIQQYRKRHLLFSKPDILPSFELLTIRAVQSLSAEDENFKSWSEALSWMKREIDKLEFDVAIIGAGAYGLPLGSYIKQKGKVAIHLGGASQLLFGIKGNRWKNRSQSQFFNEHWCYPQDFETPTHGKKVDGIGPYWK